MTTTGLEARGSGQTRDRILDAALQVFSTSGYDGVSIRAVERLAGVERGLAAYHFGSKFGMWTAVVDVLFQGFADEMTVLRAALRDVSRKERVRAQLVAFGRYNARHPEYFRVLLLEGHGKTERSEYLAQHVNQGIELFRDFTSMSGHVGTEEAILIFQTIGAAGTLYSMLAYFDADLAAELCRPETIEHFAHTLASGAIATAESTPHER